MKGQRWTAKRVTTHLINQLGQAMDQKQAKEVQERLSALKDAAGKFQ